jgi:hypothetical protein
MGPGVSVEAEESRGAEQSWTALAFDAVRSGTIAGVAMIPFAALFRAAGLRINEYGRKTLELVVGQVPPRLHDLLTFIEHLIISCIAAVPLLLLLSRFSDRRTRVIAGALYGLAFYVVVNSILLPWAFGDPTPWHLGVAAVYPSLLVHLVYGVGVSIAAKAPRP